MKKLIQILLKGFAGKKEHLHPDNGKSVAGELDTLQNRIGYRFQDISILRISLTHTSCYFRNGEHISTASEYERMEFLGDSILGFVAAEYLFTKYPDNKEGFLSKLKSQVVSENYLADRAKSIKLGDYIYLGDEELRDKGYNKKSILSDMMESLICALYFDGGLETAKKFILDYILSGYSRLLTNDEHINYKSKIQEYSQSLYRKLPQYKVLSAEGPDHKKIFTVKLYIKDEMVGTGKGYTKKNAEQEAAKEGCKKLNIS